jgi:hypothetical protein
MCVGQLATKTTQRTSRHPVTGAPRRRNKSSFVSILCAESFLNKELQLTTIVSTLKIFASTILAKVGKKSSSRALRKVIKTFSRTIARRAARFVQRDMPDERSTRRGRLLAMRNLGESIAVARGEKSFDGALRREIARVSQRASSPLRQRCRHAAHDHVAAMLLHVAARLNATATRAGREMQHLDMQEVRKSGNGRPTKRCSVRHSARRRRRIDRLHVITSISFAATSTRRAMRRYVQSRVTLHRASTELSNTLSPTDSRATRLQYGEYTTLGCPRAEKINLFVAVVVEREQNGVGPQENFFSRTEIFLASSRFGHPRWRRLTVGTRHTSARVTRRPEKAATVHSPLLCVILIVAKDRGRTFAADEMLLRVQDDT